jgi:hypothetical protein
MTETIPDSFNRLLWHDSKLRSVHIFHKDDLDEVSLSVDIRGIHGQDLASVTISFQDSVFFFGDLDLQGKRECSDDISSATCNGETELLARLQNDRLRYSPNALSGYFHFSFYLIPPGGTLDIVALGFRIEART